VPGDSVTIVVTLDDLRVFVAVAIAGNLSDVARDVGCTQPAVSQRVRRLETELGVTLVERHARGVDLTEAGRLLHAGITESLGALDSALARIETLRDGEAGSVRIATGGTAVKHFMARAVSRFRERFPRASLEFLSANSTRRCLDALVEGEADLAWITMGADTPGIRQLPAASMPWTLIGPSDDALLTRKRIKPEMLQGLRYIPLREEAVSQAQLRSALNDRGATFDETASVDDWDTAVLLVELGFGYAIVPAVHGRVFAEAGQVRAAVIDGLPDVTFGWAFRRWEWLTPAAQEFVDILAREVGKMRGIPGLHVHTELAPAFED
jgi:DNA-binding transcriptional LysR family regulator